MIKHIVCGAIGLAVWLVTPSEYLGWALLAYMAGGISAFVYNAFCDWEERRSPLNGSGEHSTKETT